MLHIPNSAEENSFEKRHKINKFSNYQNILIVRNSPALDGHVLVPSQQTVDLNLVPKGRDPFGQRRSLNEMAHNSKQNNAGLTKLLQSSPGPIFHRTPQAAWIKLIRSEFMLIGSRQGRLSTFDSSPSLIIDGALLVKRLLLNRLVFTLIEISLGMFISENCVKTFICCRHWSAEASRAFVPSDILQIYTTL